VLGFGGCYSLGNQLFKKLINKHFMKKNLGNTDRIIRVILALVLAAVSYTGVVTGTFATILYVLAGVLVATSLVSFCPLYAIVGLNTCPVKKS
jgi:uncharacterized membrane protein